jgi:hypothetical protein
MDERRLGLNRNVKKKYGIASTTSRTIADLLKESSSSILPKSTPWVRAISQTASKAEK